MKGFIKWLAGKPLATVRRRVLERATLLLLVVLGVSELDAHPLVAPLVEAVSKLFGW